MSNREEVVTKLTFDNAQFERGVKESIKSLDDLSRSLKLDKAAEGLINLERQASNFSLDSMSSAVTKGIKDFGALGVAGVTAVQDITHSVMDLAKKIPGKLTKPITSGLQEYETQINAVQTILTNTKSKGTTIDQVNSALNELNLYADKTIYNFTQMTENIGRFTASGVGLEESVAAIKGISNLAAASGSNMEQAGRAMYNLSHALASGTLKLVDWNSVVNAGMGGEIFQQSLMETARVHGVAVDEMIEKEGSFKDSLSEGWITSEILLETLQKFTGDLTDDQLRSLGYTEEQIAAIQDLAKMADDAATQVKTFTQLKDTMAESMQSGWTQTWQLIIGDLEQAQKFWTGISDILNGIISKADTARNDFVAAIMGSPKVAYDDWLKFAKSGNFTEPIKQALIAEAKKSGVAIEEILAKYATYGDDAFTASIREEGWLTEEMIKNVQEKANQVGDLAESYGEAIHSYSELAQVVNDVEMGVYRNSDTGRYDLLREAGWDPELVQQLVNLDLAGVAIDWENLNDEQLRNLGISDEIIARFHEMNGEYTSQIDNAESLNSLIGEGGGVSGRELLLGGITNIVQAATDAVDLFGQVWNEVFPPAGPEGIYTLLQSFKEFTDSFQIFTRVTDEEGNVVSVELTEFGEKVKTIFTGIADAIGIIADIIGAVIGAIGSFLAGSDIDFNFDIFQFFADIATAISQFRDAMQSGELFSGFMETFGPLFAKIKGIVDTIGTIVGDFFSGKGLNTELLEKLQQDIPAAFEEVSKFAKDTLKNVWSSIKEFLKGKGINLDWIEEWKKKIKTFDLLAFLQDAFFGGGISRAIQNLFGNVDIGAEIQKAWGSFSSWFSGLDLVNDPVGTVSAVWNGFVEWFNSLGIEFDPQQALQDAWNAFVTWFEGLEITFDPKQIVTNAWNAFTTWCDSLGVEFDPVGAVTQGWTEFKSWFEGLQLRFDPHQVLQFAWDEFNRFITGQNLEFDPQGAAVQAWTDFQSWFESLNIRFNPNDGLGAEWGAFKSWFEGLLLTFDPSGNLSRAFQDFSNFIEQLATSISFGEGNPLYDGWMAIKNWFEGLNLDFDPNGLLSMASQELGGWFDILPIPDLSQFDPAKKWEEFTSWFNGLGQTLIFDENSMLAQAVQAMSEFFSNISIDTSALANVGGIVEGLATNFQSLIDSIFGAKKAYAGESEDTASDIDVVKESADGLVQTVEDTGGVFSAGNDIFSQIAEAANGAFQSLTSEGAVEAGIQLLSQIPDVLKTLAEAYALYKIGSIIGDIGNAVTSISDNLGSTITNVGNELGKAIAGSDASKVQQINAENNADVIRAKAERLAAAMISISLAIFIVTAAVALASTIEDPEAAVEPILLAVGAIGLVLGAFALVFSGTGGTQTIGGQTITAPKTDPSKLKLPDGTIFLGIAFAIQMMVGLIDDVKAIELSPFEFLKVISIMGAFSVMLGIAAGLANIGGGSSDLGPGGAILAVPFAIKSLLNIVNDLKESGVKKEDLQDALDIVTTLGTILGGGLALANLGQTVSGIGTGVASIFNVFGKKGPGGTVATQNKTAMQNVTQVIDIAGMIGAYVGAIKDLLNSVKELSEYMSNEDGTTNEVVAERLDKAVGMIATISLIFDALAAITTAGGRMGGVAGIFGMLAGAGSMMIVTQGIIQVIESAKSIAQLDVAPEKMNQVRWLIEAIGGVFGAIDGIGALAGGLGGAGGVFGMIFGSGGSWVVGDVIIKILSTVEEMSSDSYSDHKIEKVTGLIGMIGGIFTAIETTSGIVGGAGKGWGDLGMLAGSGGSWIVGDAIVRIFDVVDNIAEYDVVKIDYVTKLVGAIGGVFSVLEIIGGVAGSAGGVWGTLGTLAVGGATWLAGQGLSSVIDSISEAFDKLAKYDASEIQGIVENFNTLVEGINGFEIGKKTGEAGVGFIEGVILGVGEWIGEIANWIAEQAGLLGTSLWNGIVDIVNQISNGLGLGDLLTPAPIVLEPQKVIYNVDGVDYEVEMSPGTVIKTQAGDKDVIVALTTEGDVTAYWDGDDEWYNYGLENNLEFRNFIDDPIVESIEVPVDVELNPQNVESVSLGDLGNIDADVEMEVAPKFVTPSAEDISEDISFELAEGIKYAYEQVDLGDGNIGYNVWDLASGMLLTTSGPIPEEMLGEYKDAGIDITNGIADGIVEGSVIVHDAVNSTAEGINTAFRAYFGINSPSTVFAEHGENLDAGLARGINSGGGVINTALRNMYTSMMIVLNATLPGYQEFGSEVTRYISEGINYGGSYILTAINNMKNGMLAAINSFGIVEFYWAGFNMIDGFTQGIAAGGSYAIDAAVRVATDSLNAAKQALDEHSPSKKAMQIGEFFSQGIGIGISNAARFVTDRVGVLGDDLIGSLRTTAQLVDAVMNDELDMNPTITPVIDMSNLQNANNLMDGVFRSRATSLAYSIDARNAEVVDPIDRLIERLDAKNDFGNTTIYMDGARLNDDEAMRAVTLDFLYGLKRKAAL